MNVSKNEIITYFKKNEQTSQTQPLIIEEPLSIRIEGNPYSVVMRTPGDEIAHVAGFCLAEGLVDSPTDIVTIGFCTEENTNVATVTLTNDRKKKVADLLDRKGFVSQTSCGICGKEVVNDLHQITTPVKNSLKISLDQVRKCADRLASFQPIHKKTRSAHAALIFDKDLKVLSSAEDVGRHNALDKAIGKTFMDSKISDARFGIMSSRLSYELVQKAARAGLEMLVGISRPTSLGVDLARAVNMTLACARGDDLMVFCGKDRFIFPENQRNR
ncbi:MAG: formate dehydrogenase accessory sulfurtransferase FdhD [Desulfobacteraceae bacterium]|nr:formate dehydrogenase accessory sulfurtransferase FdhD [Desulfobacteraceae bacterium]MBC2755701.1 formate dehydrogenase accessory sulfurtransferase FdhD [Desulfobacteraceae bacterium]